MTEPGARQNGIKRTYLQVAGIVLTAASLGYVVYELVHADWSALQSVSVGRVIAMSAAGILAYCGLGILLTLAWWQLLRALSSQETPFNAIFRIYAITQVYKYLPTNVLHFMGRHAALRQTGYSHAVLATAMVVEALSLATAAGLVAMVFGADALFEAGARYISVGSAMLWLALGALVLLGLCGAYFFLARRQLISLPDVQPKTMMRGLLVTNFTHAVFFTGCGLILLGLVHGLSELSSDESALLIAVAATSWLLGFIVPGAAAGIGVREAVIVLLLSQPLGSAAAIALAGLYRVATIGGDALLALVCLVVRPVSPPSDS